MLIAITKSGKQFECSSKHITPYDALSQLIHKGELVGESEIDFYDVNTPLIMRDKQAYLKSIRGYFIYKENGFWQAKPEQRLALLSYYDIP